MVQLKPARTYPKISMRSSLPIRYQAYLIQNRRHDLLKQHPLVRRRRKDLIKLIRLIAKRTRPHRQLDLLAPYTVRGDDDAAVLAHFALVAASTPDDDVDVRLLATIF